MMNRGHALSRDELIRTLTAYQGITTANGAAGGTTLIDSNLIGRNDFVTGKTILIMWGNAQDEDLGAVGFDPVTGTITVEPVGFSAQILAGIVFRILNISSVETKISSILALLGQVGRPEVQLYEGWQDELGIDFTLWTVANPATAWARGAGAGIAVPFLVASAPLLINEVARLVGNQRWQLAPNIWGANTIIRLTTYEFEMTLSDVTQLVPGTCFWGLTPIQAANRATPNIIGFGLVGAAPAQALQTVTDLLGIETVNTGFGENLAAYNKLKIVVLTVAGVPTPTVLFYLNEVLIATHIANLPDLPMYPNFYFDTTGLGPCTPQIGVIRIDPEDFQRP